MPTKFTCPECKNTVLVPNAAAKHIGYNEQIGCGNVEKHDKGAPLIMWEDTDDIDDHRNHNK